MRLLSYNILDGGEGRADPLAEIIEAQKADLVALIEADNQAVTERIAKRLAMDFVTGEGKGHSVALLSRFPIVQSINYSALNPGLSRCCMESTVIDPNGDEWPIGLIHLPAGATDPEESVRLRHIQTMLGFFEKHRQAGTPHLLCGDFNSNAPYHNINPARCRKKTQAAWAANGNNLPRRVVQSIMDAGYVDTFTHEAGADLIGTLDTHHPGQKVDYIFAFGLPADGVKSAWVEQDRLAKYASDHYPVGAEIS
jgi:endonuclease/exonuclease/phosphatase family metal-dependent hydrolase